jgi:hypothetical protein
VERLVLQVLLSQLRKVSGGSVTTSPGTPATATLSPLPLLVTASTRFSPIGTNAPISPGSDQPEDKRQAWCHMSYVIRQNQSTSRA